MQVKCGYDETGSGVLFIPSQSPVCELVTAPPWGEPWNGAVLAFAAVTIPSAYMANIAGPGTNCQRRLAAQSSLSSFRTAMKASLGTETVPKVRIRFLPSFCFSSSFFFLVISPP